MYFLLDELGPALAEFDLAAKDRTAHDPTTVSYGRVGAEACRIVSGSGRSSVLSDAVDEPLRMQMMYTSTQGLLLACAAAVSGALYKGAARYSALAFECTHRSGGVTQAAYAVEWAAQSLVAMKRWEPASAAVGLRGRHPRLVRRHRTTDRPSTAGAPYHCPSTTTSETGRRVTPKGKHRTVPRRIVHLARSELTDR